MVKKDMEIVKKYQKEMFLLGRANALLNWDQEVYMPEGGIKGRAEQSAFLSKLGHDRATSNVLFTSLKKLMKSRTIGKDKVMVDKLYKGLCKSRKIPHSLVEDLSRTTMIAGPAWRKARKKNDYSVFAPYLQKIIDLKIKEAKFLGFKGHLYNGLLDDYEEGMTVEELKPIFEKLKKGLIELLRKIKKSKKYGKKLKLLGRKYDAEGQKFFVEDVVVRMGLDMKKSRIDLSEHPFTTRFGVGDVRITMAYRDDPMFAFLSTVHEAGHALYESNLPVKHEYDILGDAPSIGLHESQSRMWENNVGKGKAFWKYYFPLFKKKFKLSGNFEDWYKEVNSVFSGYIRIESDEVHYCLHVILRFEIELGLLDGSIKVKDLRDVWNSKFKEMFGIKPRNDVEGVLQDVHWSFGSVGYFPTYAIGTMYASQLYNQMKKELKGIDKEIGKGNFSRVQKWLKEKVHKHGSLYLADEIVKKVCGEGLNPEIYLKYLNNKYGEIYRF
jgi:carboxypeptidase Taq